MSPPQADPHIALYNSLPLIGEAHAILRRELKADPLVSKDDLMRPILEDPEVQALFREEDEGSSFEIWIVHRHFLLENGERMVSVGNTARPVAQQLTHTAERWDASGNAIEFVQPDEDAVPPQKAPSASFVKVFHDLMLDKFGVSVLGVCLPAADKPDGYVYLERTDPTTRSQITDLVPAVRDNDPNFVAYQSSWSVVDRNCGRDCTTGQCLGCVTPSPSPPPSPPVSPPTVPPTETGSIESNAGGGFVATFMIDEITFNFSGSFAPGVPAFTSTAASLQYPSPEAITSDSTMSFEGSVGPSTVSLRLDNDPTIIINGTLDTPLSAGSAVSGSGVWTQTSQD